MSLPTEGHACKVVWALLAGPECWAPAHPPGPPHSPPYVPVLPTDCDLTPLAINYARRIFFHGVLKKITLKVFDPNQTLMKKDTESDGSVWERIAVFSHETQWAVLLIKEPVLQ